MRRIILEAHDQAKDDYRGVYERMCVFHARTVDQDFPITEDRDAWLVVADKLVFYVDHGFDDAIIRRLEKAVEYCIPVELRSLFYADASQEELLNLSALMTAVDGIEGRIQANAALDRVDLETADAIKLTLSHKASAA